MKMKGYDPIREKQIEILINDGKIDEVNEIFSEEDLPCVSYGFVDIQVNGYNGLDYSSGDFSADQIRSLIEILARHGVTQHFPTIISSTNEEMKRSVRIIRGAREESPLVASAIPGIHLEGPYISDEDGPRGAHGKEFVRDADLDEFMSIFDDSKGLIRLVTLAPERKNVRELIQFLKKNNVVASIGHTAASSQEIHEAVKHGVELSTHLGNASHARIPRLNNYIWAQLADSRLAMSLISDGYHIPDDVLKVFYAVKGEDKTILISDVAPMAGYVPGSYKWKSLELTVHEDGHLSQTGTSFLAGAGHLLDHCISHFVSTIGISVQEALRLVTRNPKKLFGLDNGFGEIKAGTTANLVFYTEDENRAVLPVKTVLNGDIVFNDV